MNVSYVTKRKTRLRFITLVVIFLNYCESFKILIIPQPARSHMMSLARIGEQLTHNGHSVHFLVSKDINFDKDQMAEVTSSFQIERYGSANADNEVIDFDAVQDNFTRAVIENKAAFTEVLPHLQAALIKNAKLLLNDNNALIERLDKEHFDVAVVDCVFFVKEAYLIPLRLNIPWVTYTDIIPQWIVKVPYLPSFVPARPIGISSEQMTFAERFINTVFEFVFLLYLGKSEPSEDIVLNYRKYGNFSTMDDLIAQSLLFITTTDNIVDYAKPLMPNIIHAAGLTVKPSTGKYLSDDIESFMAGAKRGIILVTFGSMASSFPPDIGQKLMSTFKRFGNDYRIIFRFNNKDNLPIPENVMISPWLPQNDILADPRVKLFITHCGNNGQYEAIYHGVPMIGFPLLGDQPYNAKRLVHKGFGLSMDIHSFTSEDLYQNILKILTDSSYKKCAQHASDIFKSAKETPAEKAAYWIEHVTKFGGEHLRSAGSDLNVFQYLLLDVFLAILVIILLFSFCICRMIKFICSKCCFRSKKSLSKKKHE